MTACEGVRQAVPQYRVEVSAIGSREVYSIYYSVVLDLDALTRMTQTNRNDKMCTIHLYLLTEISQ